ncbi:MAG: glycosyltransferase family 2 protein [Paracoccaceae bacterium]
MKITAVTCVKNEGPFLLEWIAFNRLIGVTDFLFYSNDCTDGTDHLLNRLADHNIVQHLDNPATGRSMQMQALTHSRTLPITQHADWQWIADVDEYLNIHVGQRRIPDLIAACKDPKAISITFQFFANDGVKRFEDRPVIEQFTKSHNPDLWCGQSAIEVKTLMRKDFPLRRFGAHRPFVLREIPKAERKPRWTDGSGRQVPPRFLNAVNKRRIHKFPSAGARNFATLNHYALRSLDSYLVKNDRGDVNRTYRYFDDVYWRERNDAALVDDSILHWLPALTAEIARLKTLPGIADLHADCVRLHRAHCAKLLETEDFQNMRTQLLNASPFAPDEAEIRQLIGLPI